MVTDFSEFTNAGLQHITFNGVDSLADLGILITSGTSTDDVSAKSIKEDIPFTQGSIDLSRKNGELYYESRSLHYEFKVFADNETELCNKRAAIRQWLSSNGNNEIIDSAEDGYRFVNCVLKGIGRMELDVDGVCGEYITADFECYPFKLSPTGTQTALVSSYGPGFISYIIDNKYINTSREYGGKNFKKTNVNKYSIAIPTRITGLCMVRFGTSLNILHADDVLLMYKHEEGGVSAYFLVGYAENGYLSFTVTVASELGNEVDCDYSIGEALTFEGDKLDGYYIEAYVMGDPLFKVNGEIKELGHFSIADQHVNSVSITGSVDGIYILRYDSVERRI